MPTLEERVLAEVENIDITLKSLPTVDELTNATEIACCIGIVED